VRRSTAIEGYRRRGPLQRRVIPRAPALAELLGKRDNDALGPADVG
jgi:hypothetical protein